MSCTFQENTHDEQLKLSGLKKGAIITFIFFAVEFATSYLTNSLAVFGDSIHMFADGIIMTLTFWVYKLRSIPPRNSVVGYLSFGFRRLELLIIILNTTLVGMAIFWIIRESYLRLTSGHVEVIAWPVFLVGAIGFAVNLTVFRTLNVHSHEEEGIKSAVACALTDALGSVAVIVGSVAILIDRSLFWVDTTAALAIAGMLIWSFRKTPRVILNMIMEATPADIDFKKVVSSIKQVYGVDDVLDLHINKISSSLIVMTGQISIESHVLHDFIPGLIKAQIQEEFPELKNAHLTFETRCCIDPATESFTG